jgi:hypothetical protein
VEFRWRGNKPPLRAEEKKSPTVLKVEPGVFPEIIAINVFAKLFPTSSGAPD